LAALKTVLQYGHSTSNPTLVPATDSRAPHCGHGAISTGAAADPAAGAAGTGTDAGSGLTGTDPVAGIWNWDWHFGQVPRLPAFESSTVKVAPRPGQANRIIVPSA
jgi:hypothetical protein